MKSGFWYFPGWPGLLTGMKTPDRGHVTSSSCQKVQHIFIKQLLVTFFVTLQLLSHILSLIWSCVFPLTWQLHSIPMPQSAPWCKTCAETGSSSQLYHSVVWLRSWGPGDHTAASEASLLAWWKLWLGNRSMVWRERMEKKERQE